VSAAIRAGISPHDALAAHGVVIAPPMIASQAPAAPTTQPAQGVARKVAPIARWRLASPSRQRKTARSSTVRRARRRRAADRCDVPSPAGRAARARPDHPP
jgi:hypothetical protein